MKEKLKKIKWSSLIFIIIGIFIGFKFGERLGSGLKNMGLLRGIVYPIIALVIAFYFQIIVHEGGHLIFGLLTGYKFVSFRIGALTIVKIDGKLRIKKYNIEGTGGQCLLEPPALDEEDNYPNILYNLGGGLLNILVSIVFIYLSKNYLGESIISIFLDMGGLVGIILGLTNLIPLKLGGMPNDGHNILSLMKDKDSKLGLWRQLKVNALLVEGVRLKDMDENWFDKPEGGDMKNPLVNSMVVSKVGYYMDKEDFASARELTYELLDEDGIIDVHSKELKSELIFLEIMNDNFLKAEELYKDMKEYIDSSKKYYITRRRLLYGYELFINHDVDKANEELRYFNKMIKSYPYISEVEGEKELIELIDKKYSELTNI